MISDSEKHEGHLSEGMVDVRWLHMRSYCDIIIRRGDVCIEIQVLQCLLPGCGSLDRQGFFVCLLFVSLHLVSASENPL